ncbi:MAG: tetratricopeptide repeat protein, partial [Gemmatimonadota bacterium]|nr:tetratricopeptide repeat protein [Gemmatimonadota bacterium]
MITVARSHGDRGSATDPARAKFPVPEVSSSSPALQRVLSAARAKPKSVALRHDAADALRAAAFVNEAIDAYRVVLAMDPARGTAHRDLGNVLVDNGRLAEGLEALQRAVALLPEEAGTLLGLVRTLQKLGRAAEAAPFVERLAQAAAVHPSDARRALYHALALSQVGRLDDAIAGVRTAIALDDTDAEAWEFLGLLLCDRAAWDEARVAYDAALERAPGRPQTLFHRGTLRLRLGDYEGGFGDYEARWESPLFTTARRDYGVPRWQGEPLGGRALLVHTEQGLGDTLQFVRFIPVARAHGAGRIVIECEDSLVRLLASVSGVDAVVRRGQPLPAVDCHVPLMSLARIAGATVDTVGFATPYLGVDAIARALPPRKAETRLRIGIVFEASRAGGSFGAKSLPIEYFAPLA